MEAGGQKTKMSELGVSELTDGSVWLCKNSHRDASNV